MAYMNKSASLAVVPIAAGAADDLGATGVHTYAFYVMSQIEVTRFLVGISTVMNGAATVVCKRYPLFGSSSGAVSIATIIVPTTTAVGKVMYKDCDPVTCFPGDEIVFEVTSAATSGGGHYGIEYEIDPEYKGNQTDMVATA